MIGARPCLVCQEKTTSEGQLCPDCVAAGHRVENGALFFNLEVRLPDHWQS